MKRAKRIATTMVVGACIGMTLMAFTASAGSVRFAGYCGHGSTTAGHNRC